MDVNLTPDLSSTISLLGQYYPMQGTQEQAGGGAGMAGLLGGADATDYSGQFADIRGLVDKGLGQITNLSQAQSVLGGQINAFSGTLTGVQSQVGGINSQVGDLKNQLASSIAQQAQIQQGLNAATASLGTMGTNITGLQTGMTGLQAADASQMAYMQRLGAAIEKIKSGIKV
jgi:chromosome segregation ATPase